MKAAKKTAIKLKFNSHEYHMLMEIIRKIIDGEAPLHEIGILKPEQLKFLQELQKLLNDGSRKN